MEQREYKNYILNLIRNGKNPQEVVLDTLSGPMSQTPLGANLIKLAREGKGNEIEQIARNMVAQQGKDFDKEFNAFKKEWGFEK